VPELASSFEDAWARFQTGSIETGDATADWTHGRAQLLIFLIRVEERDVRRYAAGIVERIAGIAGVEPVPEDLWHVTVKAAGFQVIKRSRDDDILREEVPRLGRQAGELLANQQAYEARIGLPNVFPDAVVLEVHDGGHTRELNAALAMHESLTTYPFDGDRFLPHVTIAHLSSSEGLAEIRSALAELRDGGHGPSFTVGRIDFVKAWLVEGADPEFETIRGYRLAP